MFRTRCGHNWLAVAKNTYGVAQPANILIAVASWSRRHWFSLIKELEENLKEGQGDQAKN